MREARRQAFRAPSRCCWGTSEARWPVPKSDAGEAGDEALEAPSRPGCRSADHVAREGGELGDEAIDHGGGASEAESVALGADAQDGTASLVLEVDVATGLRASPSCGPSRTEVFVEGTAPDASCREWTLGAAQVTS